MLKKIASFFKNSDKKKKKDVLPSAHDDALQNAAPSVPVAPPLVQQQYVVSKSKFAINVLSNSMNAVAIDARPTTIPHAPPIDQDTDLASCDAPLAELLQTLQKASQVAPRIVADPRSETESKSASVPNGTVPDTAQYWKKGTGYGHNGVVAWDVQGHANMIRERNQRVARICRNMKRRVESDDDLTDDMVDAMRDSCLLPLLASQLENDSMVDLHNHGALYHHMFDLMRSLSEKRATKRLFFVPIGAARPSTLADMLERVNALFENLNKLDQEVLRKVADSQDRESEPTRTSSLVPAADTQASQYNADELVASKILDDCASIMQNLKSHSEQDEKLAPAETESPSSESSSSSRSLLSKIFSRKTDAEKRVEDEEYVKALELLRFDMVDSFSKFHGFGADMGAMPRKLARRLASEFSDLSKSLPVTATSSIFVRANADDMSKLQMLILAPDETPYGFGAFLFDVLVPSNYPQAPPKVNLQTTGNGTVRFNPNLYESGYVCLSLLGTWSGDAGEMWSPGSSTLLQVAVSIQSLIFVPEPYFNEPGYERTMNSAAGRSSSDAYNRNIRDQTVRWAICDMIRNKPKGFEDIITMHFAAKKQAVLKQCASWKIDTQLQKELDSLFASL